MSIGYKKYLEQIDIQNTRARLMMLCGCLHDIAENSKEVVTKKQLKTVQEALEKIINK